jgi:hypothetical protein
MGNLGKWLFLLGLVAAVVVAFIKGNIAPWVVGGLGIVVGLLNVKAAEVRSFLLAATGLAVALFVIRHQPYNPPWLTDITIYVNVFVTHILLVVGLLAFFRTAKD